MTPTATKLQVLPLPFLRRMDGRLHQAVRIHYPAAEAAGGSGWTLQVIRGSFRTTFLMEGGESQTVFLPESDAPVEATFIAEREGEQEKVLLHMGPVRRWTVHLVLHSHTDLGFTAPVSEVAELHNLNTDRAVEFCRETAHLPEGHRFRWTCEVAWQVQNYIRDRPQEGVEALMRLVRGGEIAIGALYSGELTGLLGHEEAVRAFAYAGYLRRRYGIPCDTAMLCDVPGCTAGLVQIMAKSGVSALIIADNNFLAPFLPRTDLPRPFLWKGSDATEVLCWFTDHPFYAYVEGEYYGFLESRQKVEQMLGAKLLALELGGYPYDRFQIQYAFDNAPITLKPATIVRELAAQWEYPRIVLSTAREFLAAMREEHGTRFPSRRGDWCDWWGGIVTGFPVDEALSRSCHERTPIVEALGTHLALRASGKGSRDTRISGIYDGLLAFDEHSGGGNLWQPASRERQDRALHEGYGFLHSAASELDIAEADALKKLAALAAHPEADRLKGFYNPSGVAISRTVAIIADGSREGHLRLRNLPPYSWRLVQPGQPETRYGGGEKRVRAVAEEGLIHLETASCRVSIDRGTGRWVSYVEKEGPGELVAAGEALNAPCVYRVHPVCPIVLGKYIPAVYDGTPHPGEFLPWPRASTPLLTWSDDPPGTAICAVEHRIEGVPWLVQQYVVSEDLAGVGLVNTLLRACFSEPELRSALQGFLDPGGLLYFQFPFSGPCGTVEYEATASVLRPAEDQFRGSCHDFAAVQRWCALRGTWGGVLLTVQDTPLVDFGSPGLLRFKERPDDHPSAIFVRAVSLRDLGGPDESPYTRAEDLVFRFGVSFIPDDPAFPGAPRFRAEAHRRAVQDATPLIQFTPAKGTEGMNSRVEGAFLSLTPDTVELMALKPAESGKGWILRLRETTGSPMEAHVAFPGFRIADCVLVQMTEETISSHPFTEEGVRVSLTPFAIVTLLIDLLPWSGHVP